MTQKTLKTQNKRNTNKNKDINDFYMKFYGVRGTMPVAGASCLKYGGNTSCVLVKQGVREIVLDAGTGIISYGQQAVKAGKKVFHILLSHFHYDHMIGLTCFLPFFQKDVEIYLYGQPKYGLSLQEIFERFFQAPFFPKSIEDMPCRKGIFFKEIYPGQTHEINGMKVETFALNHPQESLAFRIWDQRLKRSIVYSTDHEHGTARDQDLIEFIRGANALIYDATFEEKEYKNFQGWGHSCATQGARFAKAADVDKYFIFHHEKDHSDRYLDQKILPPAKAIFSKTFLAKENATVVLK